MNDKPILLKVKDWVELQMGTTPFLSACMGLGVLILTSCYGVSLILAAIPWGFLSP